MAKPKVTYILPTIRERWVRATINSVLDQTMPDWEMIILDKNHTVGSHRDKRITVLDRKTKPHNECVELARSMAKSDIILHIYDDDMDCKNRAEYIYEHMLDPKIDLYIGSYYVMTEDAVPYGIVETLPFDYKKYRLEGLNMPLFCSGYRNSTCPKGRPDFHLLGDYCFFTDCYLKGLNIATDKEPLAFIRTHAGQVNKTDSIPEMKIFWDIERYKYCKLYGVDRINR
jgi:glycosyltransferase involved in cell wall biosynthesis